MKKLAALEIFIGLLTITGAFIVGEQAVSALILTALLPLTSKKIGKNEIDFEGYYKISNLFFAFSVLTVLSVSAIINVNRELQQVWLPLTTGGIVAVKGILDLFFISRAK